MHVHLCRHCFAGPSSGASINTNDVTPGPNACPAVSGSRRSFDALRLFGRPGTAKMFSQRPLGKFPSHSKRPSRIETGPLQETLCPDPVRSKTDNAVRQTNPGLGPTHFGHASEGCCELETRIRSGSGPALDHKRTDFSDREFLSKSGLVGQIIHFRSRVSDRFDMLRAVRKQSERCYLQSKSF